ncbi:MAG: MotA/TolQ/ExbB proton channel family protein [Mangrovibacterium sp.]
MNTLTGALYWISTGLLVPVIVLLLILFLQALIMIGTFYGQYVTRKKTDRLLSGILDTLNSSQMDSLEPMLPQNMSSLHLIYLRKLLVAKDSEAHCHRLLANFEIEADSDLAKSKTLTKLGPILGLMGTLIPMGPALVGLSTGDIGSMAYNMQVAFSTTVVGLVAGAIGFFTLQVKQRWYLQDVINLEFISRLLLDKNPDK